MNNTGTMTVADTGRTFDQAMQHRANRVLPGRYGLIWIAGQRGKPNINADMASGTEATREPSDPDFEILGTSAVSADTAFAAEGGIRLSTHGGNNDQTILLPHLDTNQSGWANVTWGTDQQTRWECSIATGSSIASYLVYAGLKLTNDPTVATDNDQAYFRFSTGDTDATNWQIVYSIGGTDTQKSTEVTVAASTKYHLAIEIDEGRVARFYINQQLVYTSTPLTDATDLIPYIGVQALTAAVKYVDVMGQAISRHPGA